MCWLTPKVLIFHGQYYVKTLPGGRSNESKQY